MECARGNVRKMEFRKPVVRVSLYGLFHEHLNVVPLRHRSLNNAGPRPIAALASSAIRKRQAGNQNAGDGDDCSHWVISLRFNR